MLLQRAFFGQRGRWLQLGGGTLPLGLLGGVRWSCSVLGAYLAITLVAAPETVKVPSGSYLALLVVVLLTTPFQAAGEEYGARGLITRGAGSWFASPRTALLVGTLLSGAVFTLAHGAATPGSSPSTSPSPSSSRSITWRTGGLELAVLLHTANNLVAFGGLVLLRRTPRRSSTAGPAAPVPSVLLPAVVLLLSAGALWLWASGRTWQRTYVPEPVRPARPRPRARPTSRPGRAGPWTLAALIEAPCVRGVTGAGPRAAHRKSRDR